MNEFGKGCQRPGGKGIRREGGILSRPPIITICVWLPCPTSSVCVCCLVGKRVSLAASPL